jgi:hypothetical protein
MRRPRRKLEVNTFPFLAVLLCAMGSFILLLMIIDRRGKIAAQNKARDAYLAHKIASEMERDERAAAAKDQEATLKAAWQAEKDKIHSGLQAEEDALARQITQLLAALTKTDDQIARQKTTAQARAEKIDLENVALAALRKDLQSRRNQLDQAKEASQSHVKLREQLTRDLVLLETALRNVQERKARERPVYSLVPYKGKHGASSKPVYIEVSDQTVAVHPGPTTLDDGGFSPEALRRAIEERTGPLEREALRRPGMPPVERDRSPYVLFLVRPHGIARYYESLQALRDYRVDYGYELVEADWAFDFSTDKIDHQPWRNVAKLNVEPSRVTRPAPKGIGPRIVGPGGVVGDGVGNGLGGDARGGSVMGKATYGGPDGAPPRIGFGPNHGVNDAGTSGALGGGPRTPNFTGAGPARTSGSDGPGFSSPRGDGRGQGQGGAAGVEGGSAGAAGVPNGNQVRPGIAPGVVSLSPPPRSERDPNSSESGVSGANPNATPNTMASVPAGNGARGATGVPNSAAPGAGPDPFHSLGIAAPGGNGITQVQPGPPGVGAPNPLTFRNVPESPPSNSADAPKEASNNPNGNSNTSAAQTPPSLGRPSNPGEESSGEPGPRLGLSPFQSAEPARPGPRLPALGRIVGNRDFVMTVECYDRKATLSPPGRTFDLDDPDAVEQLAKLMTSLVGGRQKTVRPGEPPYRPVVHFRVQPDGRRTYYSVYPRIAEFGFPMSRETPD